MKLVFNAAIVSCSPSRPVSACLPHGLYGLAFWLMLFFVAFNILEATQPSLISRIAPPHAKGAALGVYNTTQALGLFLGGVSVASWPSMPVRVPSGLGGAILTLVWLMLGLTMSCRRCAAGKGQPHKLL
jgi:MFS-type transporter involved in bile tolerance (Atg22 family)